MRRLPLVVSLSLLAALGCSSEPTDETPRGALELFLDAMSRSARDEHALEQAYALLAEPARRELERRADLAGALAGRDFEPWRMLPQGRFGLRFAPKARGGLRERVDGDRAVVVVTGDRGQRAEVPLIREDGRWRVALEIPPTHER